jgi:hypothetical protein
MKHRNVQIAIGIIFILSLFVSSVSACSCPHHEQAAKPETASCHPHSHGANSTQGSSRASENASSSLLLGDCCCIQPAPKAATKSATIKAEGKVVKSSPLPVADPVFVLTAQVVQPAFESLSSLTDSYYNLTPGRAPPRL